MRLATTLIGIAWATGWSANLIAATIAIDGFTQGSLNYSATGANVVNGTTESGVDTLNGSRASYVDHLFDGGTSTVTLSAGGPLSVSGASQVLSLGYGATYIPFGLGVGPDLNADLSGTNALKITFDALSAGVYIQTFLFSHRGTGYGEIDNNGFGIGRPAGSADAVIPYAALTASFGGGVNLADVDSIILTMQTQGPFSLRGISAITVPEPATLLLTSLVAGVVRVRRRR